MKGKVQKKKGGGTWKHEEKVFGKRVDFYKYGGVIYHQDGLSSVVLFFGIVENA